MLEYSDSMGVKNYMYFTENKLSEEELVVVSKREKEGKKLQLQKKIDLWVALIQFSELTSTAGFNFSPPLNTVLAVPFSC